MITLVVSLKGRVITAQSFDQDRIRIGRAPENEIRIDNAALSRRHAVIERSGRVYTLVDVNDKNGIYVNGERVKRRRLNQGDTIGLAKFVLTVELNAGRSPGALRHSTPGDPGRTLEVSAPAPSARPTGERAVGHLAVDDAAVTLDDDAYVIGSAAECHLRVRGWFVPRRLALIVRGHGGFSLVSARPDKVRVNGQPVDGRVWLRDGDALELAGCAATFRAGLPAAGRSGVAA
jgi:pSer/pThr/pTyr-binding forkhead associated (FHA) protein